MTIFKVMFNILLEDNEVDGGREEALLLILPEIEKFREYFLYFVESPGKSSLAVLVVSRLGGQFSFLILNLCKYS